MIAIFISLILAYLLGSISPSYLFGKLLKGIDLRRHGSGNVGATNVFRVLGKGVGVITLLLDMGKGYAAIHPLAASITAAFTIPIDPLLYQLLMGLAVIAGHNWSVFLNFKGGKGVAATFGVLLALTPSALVVTLLVWLLVKLLTRRVALGSLAAALAMPVSMAVMGYPRLFIGFAVLLAVLIFYTHRSNIREIFFEKKP
ncbi:MAG: glycerol-3-phosphate 1-O-acyltransferase PlsY [Candidatus Omnitrophota bacterium]